MHTLLRNIVLWVVIFLFVQTLPQRICGQEFEQLPLGFLTPQPSSLAPGIQIRPYLGFGIVTGNFVVEFTDYFVKSSPSITVGFKALYGFGGDWIGFSLGINTGIQGTFQSRDIYKFEGFFSDNPDFIHQHGKYLRQRIAYWGPVFECRSTKTPLAFNLSFTRSWTSWDTNQFDDEAEDWEFIEKEDSSMGLLASVSYGFLSLSYSFHVSRAELVSLFNSTHEHRIPITSRTTWIYLALSL